ncbi:MAG: hypothetical protein HWN79_13855 [Candidatus Lokiarchaeota archaeon]|nr:hypothetical protein [Candidatus Lokiarchaeota archaeon]
MEISDLVNKKKLRCDNIVSIVLLAGILVLFVFFRLIIFVSLMVFPIFALFINGIYNIYKGLVKKDRILTVRVLRVILGISYISFSTFILLLIFSYPHITLGYIIYFISIPAFLIGFAAIIKGSIVVVYSPLYRKLNILIGFITCGISLLASYYAESVFILSLISLILLLTLNGILRSGLYLSEYGLSIRNLKNIRLVFYIMDNLHVVNLEEEVQS